MSELPLIKPVETVKLVGPDKRRKSYDEVFQEFFKRNCGPVLHTFVMGASSNCLGVKVSG